MSYYFSKVVKLSFEDTVKKVKKELLKEGFGILTEIDIKATFKKKLNADFYNYIILGTCNPNLAYQALSTERMIGTMLPCNVIVQDGTSPGTVEVAAVDPAASMTAVENPGLADISQKVQAKLKKVIDNI